MRDCPHRRFGGAKSLTEGLTEALGIDVKSMLAGFLGGKMVQG